MKIENWNGHEIRFVEKDGEWWAVARDVISALGYTDAEKALDEHCRGAAKIRMDVTPVNAGGYIAAGQTETKKTRARKTQDMSIIPERDVYKLIFHSRLPEAESFQDWVLDVIKELRKSLGLSAYEAFRLMDKEHQKEAMKKLNESLHESVLIDYIKANTIADKAVSNMHGFPKMVKKGAMDEAMLRERQPVIDDIVSLMSVNERFALGLSVSSEIYKKYGNNEGKAV